MRCRVCQADLRLASYGLPEWIHAGLPRLWRCRFHPDVTRAGEPRAARGWPLCERCLEEDAGLPTCWPWNLLRHGSQWDVLDHPADPEWSGAASPMP